MRLNAAIHPQLNLYKEVLESHEQWLETFDPYYLKKWNDNLNADPESAISEAAFRDYIITQVDGIQPNDRNSGPDFKCVKNGQPFCVEVTCIKENTILRDLGPLGTGSKFIDIKPVLKRVLRKLSAKLVQCRVCNPCLLAITTLNQELGSYFVMPNNTFNKMVLTGITHLEGDFHSDTGNITHICERTRFEYSAVAHHHSDESRILKPERQEISGALLCYFGDMPIVSGALHPFAERPFDRSLLPQIRFTSIEEV